MHIWHLVCSLKDFLLAHDLLQILFFATVEKKLYSKDAKSANQFSMGQDTKVWIPFLVLPVTCNVKMSNSQAWEGLGLHSPFTIKWQANNAVPKGTNLQVRQTRPPVPALLFSGCVPLHYLISPNVSSLLFKRV